MLLTCFYSEIEFDKTLKYNMIFVSGYLKSLSVQVTEYSFIWLRIPLVYQPNTW